MNFSTKKIIEVDEWDELVKKTYQKPYYNFQQQDGCQDRGLVRINIPDKPYNTDPDITLQEWLDADPNEPVDDGDSSASEDWYIEMYWEREFYPSLQVVANDLHLKGLLPRGEYHINIDW